MVDLTPDGRIGELIIRGRRVKADVAEAVTEGTVELSTDQITQLTMTLADDDEALLKSQLLAPGGSVDFGDLLLELTSLATTVVDGAYALEVTAQALGAQRMRRAKGKLMQRGASPTTFMARRARACGLKYVGQPSAKRKTVGRRKAETDWDAGDRLAGELGFAAFEAAGVYYFGKPTYLIGKVPVVKVSQLDDDVLARPECRRTTVDDTPVTITLSVTEALGRRFRPGYALELTDVPTFTGARYLVTACSIPLDDTQPITVTASSPVNPDKVTAPTASSGSASTGATGQGTAAAFVSYALAQAGDRYVFGVEASASDPNPNAFDCSELVEWASARAGVKFVDGSGNQLARCRAKGTTISVDKAVRTRGALLFKQSGGIAHVAISLGNGRTIEAANRAYGVTDKLSATHRSFTWDAAGLVPGMRY